MARDFPKMEKAYQMAITQRFLRQIFPPVRRAEKDLPFAGAVR